MRLTRVVDKVDIGVYGVGIRLGGQEMKLIDRWRLALGPKPEPKCELQIGDKAIILSGTWAGRMFYVTHLSEDGRWVYGNFSYLSKVSVNNCEKVRD